MHSASIHLFTDKIFKTMTSICKFSFHDSYIHPFNKVFVNSYGDFVFHTEHPLPVFAFGRADILVHDFYWQTVYLQCICLSKSRIPDQE